MAIAILNTLAGKVVSDPQVLQDALDLDEVGNIMINGNFPFSDKQREADHPGVQLAVAMMAVRMQKLDQHNIDDLMKRLACRDAVNDPPMEMPDGVESLKMTYARLKDWTAKGWGIEIGMSGLSEIDFYEMESFKIQQAVVRQVTNAFEEAKKEATKVLDLPNPEEA